MKTNLLKRSAFTLFSVSFGAVCSAHELSDSLDSSYTSTDVYYVTCSTDSGGVSDYLEFSVLDATQNPGGGKISTMVWAGGIAVQTGDPVRANADFSPVAAVHAGNGLYQVFVHKLKEGPKVYSLQYHCKSATGAHTGTSKITIQDQ